jgi:hypothetical protein
MRAWPLADEAIQLVGRFAQQPGALGQLDGGVGGRTSAVGQPVTRCRQREDAGRGLLDVVDLGCELAQRDAARWRGEPAGQQDMAVDVSSAVERSSAASSCNGERGGWWRGRRRGRALGATASAMRVARASRR